jgi:hypothetical protein
MSPVLVIEIAPESGDFHGCTGFVDQYDTKVRADFSRSGKQAQQFAGLC